MSIEGNVDYRLLRDQLLVIEQQLHTSALEGQFIQSDLDQWLKQNLTVSVKAQQNRQLREQSAL